jgi:hypothetical protein
MFLRYHAMFPCMYTLWVNISIFSNMYHFFMMKTLILLCSFLNNGGPWDLLVALSAEQEGCVLGPLRSP